MAMVHYHTIIVSRFFNLIPVDGVTVTKANATILVEDDTETYHIHGSPAATGKFFDENHLAIVSSYDDDEIDYEFESRDWSNHHHWEG